MPVLTFKKYKAMKDLFQHYTNLPKEVQDIILAFDNDGMTYEQCETALKQLEPLGYTFEYGLDAVPYNLRPVRSCLVHGVRVYEDKNGFWTAKGFWASHPLLDVMIKVVEELIEKDKWTANEREAITPNF